MKNNIITKLNVHPQRGGVNNPKTVIIHGMSEYLFHKGKYMHAEEFLRSMRLSAHFLVTPSGVGIRLRNDDQRASHALGHNTDTLGIEFLVPGLHTYASFLEDMKFNYVTSAAYDTGQEIIRNWMQIHPIERVTAHSVIDPKRKYDPGDGFPKQFYVDLYK